jgi:phosphoribosylamine--glycine ligase
MGATKRKARSDRKSSGEYCMKVLLIGSGGRESAIAYKLRESKLLSELKVYPGNAGFPDSEIISSGVIDLKNKKSVQEFVQKNGFQFVIIGPEEPLVDGIVDWLEEIHIPAFGPSSYCARLEGSKDFAKKLMKEFGVPTANYETLNDYKSSIKYIETQSFPLVIKADGLAAGKGVTVCFQKEEAISALKEIFIDNKFGKSGAKVVVEEFLDGEEASIFAICDGNKFLIFPAAQDHKRAYDGDTGPNTGGMGAYAPAPIATNDIYEKVKEQVFKPMLEGLNKKGFPYKGLLYAGLMINKAGDIKVVEFNARFGDPETQALMLLLEDDLLELMLASANGNIFQKELKLKKGFATVVVLASNGYPENYARGIEINLSKPASNSTVIFHAGTTRKEGRLVTNGGRILCVGTIAETLSESVKKCYEYLEKNPVQQTFYRKDIAKRAL